MAQDAAEPGTRRGEARGALEEGLCRLLAVEPEGRAPRRLLGALADALPALSCAALLVEDGGALSLADGIGLDDASPRPIEGGLAAEAIDGGAVRLAADPGAPFPAGTRLGAAAPFAVGGTRGALLAGTRGALLDEGALLLVRIAADRTGLLLERDRLARAAAEAVDSVRRAKEDIEHRRRAVDTILGIVGHDLRNPLGAIHMSTALLQKRGGLEGWQARTVERMRSSAGRMARIIADLLTYTRTRLGSGIPVQLREADLGAVVARVVDELRAANADREIAVDAQGELGGWWDPDRLEQVASNLVSNAVDHGDPGTPVRVVARGRTRGRGAHRREHRPRDASGGALAPVRAVLAPAGRAEPEGLRARARALHLARDRPRARRRDLGASGRGRDGGDGEAAPRDAAGVAGPL